MKTLVVPKECENLVKVLLATQNQELAQAKGDELERVIGQKRLMLSEVANYDFGKLPHEYMREAAMLQSVAFVDPELALKFSEQTPCNHAKCYAWLAIAPALSLEDPEAAKNLLKKTYELIADLPSGDRVMPNYNFPPPTIAATGLPIVEFVAPEMLPACVRQTAELAGQFSKSYLADAKANLFEVISAIARYDCQLASKMYTANSSEVDLHSAPGFFRAMLALHPELIVEEFELIPETDERKINRQIHVRNAILPALLSKDEQSFWDVLPWGASDLNLDHRLDARRKHLGKSR